MKNASRYSCVFETVTGFYWPPVDARPAYRLSIQISYIQVSYLLADIDNGRELWYRLLLQRWNEKFRTNR